MTQTVQAGFLFTACLALASGCGLGGSVSGARGNAEFSYGGCLFECGPDARAIAAGGARATIDVHTTKTVARSASSDPSVLAISPTPTTNGDGHYSFDVTSGDSGSVTMTVLDANGAEIDHVTLTVEGTQKIEVNKGWSGDMPRVIAGGTYSLHSTTIGKGGKTLVGVGAVSFDCSGSLASASGSSLLGDDATCKAVNPGQGTTTFRTRSVETRIDVQVIAPEEVDPVQMTSTRISIASGRNVEAPYKLTSHGQPVFGGCGWRIADPRIASGFDVPALGLSSEPRMSLELWGNNAGSTTVSCALRGQATTLEVSVSQ